MLGMILSNGQQSIDLFNSQWRVWEVEIEQSYLEELDCDDLAILYLE